MGVEDPGYLKATCDECGEEGDFPTTEYAGDPPSWGIDEKTLKANGWEYAGGVKVKCVDCGYEDDYYPVVCEKCAKAEEQDDSGGPCPKCSQGYLSEIKDKTPPLKPFPLVDPLTGWFP